MTTTTDLTLAEALELPAGPDLDWLVAEACVPFYFKRFAYLFKRQSLDGKYDDVLKFSTDTQAALFLIETLGNCETWHITYSSEGCVVGIGGLRALMSDYGLTDGLVQLSGDSQDFCLLAARVALICHWNDLIRHREWARTKMVDNPPI